MCDEPDLDPEMTEDFFEQSILQLDPALLTENGMLWVRQPCADCCIYKDNNKTNELFYNLRRECVV